METINRTLTFTIEHCCNCSMPFGITSDLQQRRQNDGDDFWCPNGHRQHYAESTVQKLQKKLKMATENVTYYQERTEELYEEKTTITRRLSATKGQVTKIKNRVGRGVCPCCNRSFQNLKEHMESLHPDFAQSE